jgi:hypothetical protein
MGFADLSEVHPIPNSGLDWMFTNTWNHNLPSEMNAFVENSTVNSNITHTVATRGGESLGLGPLVPLNNANNDHSPLSTNESVSLLDTPSNHPHNRCDPDDPWPMEWYAASLQDSELPMLGQPVEPGLNGSSFFGMETVTEDTRLKMKEAAMLASGSALWPALNLTHFPTKEKLDHCIDLYFAHSHRVSLTLIFCMRFISLLKYSIQTLPIIHRPTFNSTEDPVVVTLAIACIGACYTGLDRARPFSNALSELNRRLLLYLV